MLKFLNLKIILGCLLVALRASTSFAAWLPPAKPDPSAILQEAGADYRAARHEVALAKYIWFHNNALAIDSAQYGVRLSFALAYWQQLAAVYPPAMDAFIVARDLAETTFFKAISPAAFPNGAFTDAVAMNGYLADHPRDVTLFKHVELQHPKDATRAYRQVQKSLIATKSYLLCNPYLDATADYAKLLTRYRDGVARDAVKAKATAAPDDFNIRIFSVDVANLVALLIHNNRAAEAGSVADKALADVSDKEARAKITAALKGEFPKSL